MSFGKSFIISSKFKRLDHLEAYLNFPSGRKRTLFWKEKHIFYSKTQIRLIQNTRHLQTTAWNQASDEHPREDDGGERPEKNQGEGNVKGVLS